MSESEDLGSVTKSEGFRLPVFQGGSLGIEMRGERRGLRQSGYASNNTTVKDSCDWNCDSGMIAKTDLGLMETQSSSLNTCETSYDEASLSHK